MSDCGAPVLMEAERCHHIGVGGEAPRPFDVDFTVAERVCEEVLLGFN